jgi:MmyB-like transcription regulator ligand binding domain/Helix-turn-helix domain
VGTPLGDFLRARRDAIGPEAVGLPAGGRRRARGLRRSEVAALAGISVEYLVRIEQGRDRNPSPAVINALADALRLDAAEREHLRHAAKCSFGTCGAAPSPRTDVRPAVRSLLAQLEPGIAYVTNRLGDVLAHTSGFDLLARPAGLLDSPSPNLTRFVFTDERARRVFPDWDQVADERAVRLSLGAPSRRSEQLIADLTALAGPEFTDRVRSGRLPRVGTQAWCHPAVGGLLFDRELLEFPAADAQQLVVLLPANDPTSAALSKLRRDGRLALVK